MSIRKNQIIRSFTASDFTLPKAPVPIVNNPIRLISRCPRQGVWQTGCLWWESAQSRFHVDLKSNFALKNNSMEFLAGQITRRINILFESRLKRIYQHYKLAVEDFFPQTQSGTTSTPVLRSAAIYLPRKVMFPLVNCEPKWKVFIFLPEINNSNTTTLLYADVCDSEMKHSLLYTVRNAVEWIF